MVVDTKISFISCISIQESLKYFSPQLQIWPHTVEALFISTPSKIVWCMNDHKGVGGILYVMKGTRYSVNDFKYSKRADGGFAT